MAAYNNISSRFLHDHLASDNADITEAYAGPVTDADSDPDNVKKNC